MASSEGKNGASAAGAPLPKRAGAWPEVARIVIPYALFAGLWIFLSDAVLEYVTSHHETHLRLQNLKGVLFVAVTALLLAILLHHLVTRLQAGQRQLTASREHMRGLLDTLTDMVWIKSPDGRYLEITPRAARLFGHTPAEMIGHSDHELLPQALADRLHGADRTAMDSGRACGIDEWLTFPPDNHQELLHIIESPLQAPDGELLGTLGIAHEATAAHAARQAEYQALVRTETVFHACPAAIVLSRMSDGIIVEANDAFTELFGWTRDELRGRSDVDIWPDAGAYAAWRRALTAEGRLAEHETRLLDRKGEPHPVSISARIIAIDGVPHEVAFILDIGPRVAAEEKARKLHERFVRAFQAAPVAALITRLRDGILVDVNEQAIREYGGTQDDLIGRTAIENRLWKDPADREAMIARVRENGSVENFESVSLSRSGQRQNISVSATLIPLDDEPHLLAYVVNVTETVRARELLASHNQILQGIAGNAPLEQTLDGLVSLVENQFDKLIASIMLLDDKGRLRIGAAGSLPAAYRAAIDGLTIGEGRGACAAAAFRGQPVDCEDIASDPLWARLREAAAEASLGACCSLPVFDPEGDVLGTFSVHAQRPGRMPEGLRPLLETLTRTAAIAIHRKRAEAALQASERRWVLALNAAGHGLWDWDLRSGSVLFSDRWKTMLGHDPSEIPDRLDEWTSRVHPDDMPKVMAAIEAHRRGELPVYRSEHRMRERNGHWKWILDQGMVVETDADGTPTRMIGTHTDIDDFRAVIDRQRRLEMAVEQSSNSIVITDAQGIIEYVNAAFVATTGYTPEETLGRRAGFQKSGQTPPETYASLWQALTRGESWRGEFINRHKNGDLIVCFTSISPVRQADGTISHYLSVQEDITEKTRLASELARHRDHLEELVAVRTAELEAANLRLQTSDARLNAVFEMSQRVASLDERALLCL
ncbi:MAG: PAS domain S-box protein, partial [Azospira sp.]|nr:PAS domain S-box protein [Azospira sp.]